MSTARARQVRLAVLAVVLVTIAEVVTWFVLRSQGVDLGGDQGHYLIAGQALSHLSVHPNPEYQRDFLTHFIYQWPKGASVTDYNIVQTYPGPHGSVFGHGLGLPLILSPFLAIGSVPFALIGLFALNAACLVCLHQRASLLAGLSRRTEIVFALVLGAPAVWLATTQVYPDLLSGLLLALALVEIALIERQQRASIFGAAVIAIALAVEPWLQVKNLAPALCCAAVLVVLAARQASNRRVYVAMGLFVAIGWLVLLAYNVFYFSDPIGLPQPSPTFTLTTLSRTLALVLDAHQGLFVQVPTVILGVIGLWFGRKAVPLAVLAGSIGAALILLINGTFTSSVPFGGTSLAGRFQWTALPMLLVWAPLCLAQFQRFRLRLASVGLAIAVLWVFEGVPILRGNHVYENAMIAPGAPWDPTLYPTWWPGIGRWLPTFLPPGVRLGATWSHVFFEGVIIVAFGAIAIRLTREQPIRVSTGVFASLATVVSALGVALALPLRTQPLTPRSYAPTALGAPWSAVTQPTTSPVVPLVDVGPGTYRAVLTYGTVGAAGGQAVLVDTPEQRPVVSGWFTPAHPTDAALLNVAPVAVSLPGGSLAHARLRSGNGSRRAIISITVTHQSLLSFFVTTNAHATISASTMLVTKVSS